jgi:hypothetical protein
MVRSMLSESACGDFANPAQDQGWQWPVAAHEIMIGTPAIRNLIRENKIAQINSMIQTGQHTACKPWTSACRSWYGAILLPPARHARKQRPRMRSKLNRHASLTGWPSWKKTRHQNSFTICSSMRGQERSDIFISANFRRP